LVKFIFIDNHFSNEFSIIGHLSINFYLLTIFLDYRKVLPW